MRFVVYAGEKPVASNLKNKFTGENYYSCTIVGVLEVNFAAARPDGPCRDVLIEEEPP